MEPSLCVQHKRTATTNLMSFPRTGELFHVEALSPMYSTRSCQFLALSIRIVQLYSGREDFLRAKCHIYVTVTYITAPVTGVLYLTVYPAVEAFRRTSSPDESCHMFFVLGMQPLNSLHDPHCVRPLMYQLNMDSWIATTGYSCTGPSKNH